MRAAGIQVLVGCGASPGCTNLLAAYGAEKLDQVHAINISWVWPGSGGGAGVAAILHGFHIWTGRCTQFVDGEWVDVPAGSGREIVDFPQVGQHPISFCGHAEPVTLPRFIKGVQTVTCKGGVFPPILDEYIFGLASLGLASQEPLELNGVTVIPRKVAVAVVGKAIPEVERQMEELKLPEVGAIRVEVEGQAAGSEAKYTYTMIDVPSRMTAVPAAIAAQLLARKEVPRTGVLAPEALDVENMLKELRKRNFVVHETTWLSKKI